MVFWGYLSEGFSSHWSCCRFCGLPEAEDGCLSSSVLGSSLPRLPTAPSGLPGSCMAGVLSAPCAVLCSVFLGNFCRNVFCSTDSLFDHVQHYVQTFLDISNFSLQTHRAWELSSQVLFEKQCHFLAPSHLLGPHEVSSPPLNTWNKTLQEVVFWRDFRERWSCFLSIVAPRESGCYWNFFGKGADGKDFRLRGPFLVFHSYPCLLSEQAPRDNM